MKRIFVFLLCCFAVAMSSSAQGPSNRESIPVILRPIDPIGTGDPIFHAPLHAYTIEIVLNGHTSVGEIEL